MAKLELEIGTDVLLLETGDALLLEIPEVAGWAGGNVSGVAIGTVAKINGIALADIAKVNGVA